jgi:ankyrin repeat protein
MSEIMKAARDDDLDKMQRLIAEGASVHEVDQVTGGNVLMYAAYSGNAPVLFWLLKEGGARISDVNAMGWTALSIAANRGHYSLVEWMLREGGALITDVTVEDEVDTKTVWDSISLCLALASHVSTELLSLLKVMVLLDDASADFIAMMSPHNIEIIALGRQIRALQPSYMEQQHALINCISPLPSILQSIVATYAKPTSEDMWTDWLQWI